MIARLICPDGTVWREWQTTRPDLALTAETAGVRRVYHCGGCRRRPERDRHSRRRHLCSGQRSHYVAGAWRTVACRE